MVVLGPLILPLVLYFGWNLMPFETKKRFEASDRLEIF